MKQGGSSSNINDDDDDDDDNHDSNEGNDDEEEYKILLLNHPRQNNKPMNNIRRRSSTDEHQALMMASDENEEDLMCELLLQPLHIESDGDQLPKSQGLTLVGRVSNTRSISNSSNSNISLIEQHGSRPCSNASVSYWIICLVILIGDTARGVTFPTLWPLVRHLGGSEQAQGFAVAAFSFGRVFAAPYFGKMSIERGYFYTLKISLTILLLGATLYSLSEHMDRFQFGMLYLLCAQIIIGIGSGTLGVTRAFVAEITDKQSRTKYMAQITAVQYAGFTVTPIIGSFFNSMFGLSDISDDISTGTGYSQGSEHRMMVSAFSAPAYFIVFLSFLAIILLHTMFHDRIPRKKMDQKHEILYSEATSEDVKLLISSCPSYLVQLISRFSLPNIAMIICILLNVVTKGSIACFETIGIRTATSRYELTSSEAGEIVSTCGSFGVVVLLSMGFINQYFSDTQIIIGGILVMIAGISSFLFAPIIEGFGIPGSWCFVSGIFLIYSVGYPLGHTAAMALFSKIVGNRPQGELMGWFASSGSVARVSFPILAGTLKGSNILLYVLICILSATALAVRTMQFILTTLATAS